MPRMKLDLKDRLILSNQYQILQKLYPAQANDFANAQKALDRGYERNYGWFTEHMDEKPLTDEQCTEVLDILTMYDRLRLSYQQLDDKAGIKKEDVKFEGFDGNGEDRYLGYARYLVLDLKLFQDAKRQDMDSHCPMVGMYRRMLALWKPLENKHPLSKTEIQAILDERTHPENRKPEKTGKKK